MWLIKKFNNWWWKNHPPEAVQYYKTQQTTRGRLRMTDKGLVMDMQGEKYPLATFPRGHLLTNPYTNTLMSQLKHKIKNDIFNWAWAELEKGTPHWAIIKVVKEKLFGEIYSIMELQKYDISSEDKMCVAVREIWRAMGILEKENKNIKKLKEIICHICQEDDAYRFRVLFLTEYFNPSNWWFKLLRKDNFKGLKLALEQLERAEVLDDMKGRIKLLRTILLLALEDKGFRYWFDRLCKEMDWNKLKLSKADRYYARGKWMKIDIKNYEY